MSLELLPLVHSLEHYRICSKLWFPNHTGSRDIEITHPLLHSSFGPRTECGSLDP